MDSGEVTQLFLLLFLILLSAFFSSAEGAFTSVNKAWVKSLAEDKNKRAEKILKIIDDSGKMLSAILIGNDAVNLAAAALTVLFSISVWGNTVAGIAAIFIIIILILVFGEIIPKTLARAYAEKVAFAYANTIYLLLLIFRPVIFLASAISFAVLKIFRVNATIKTKVITEDELRSIVDVSHEDGVLEREERQMIYNVVDFGDSLARDIMVPRIDITFLDVDCTYSELIEIYKEVKFTRLPVYEDTTDNVIGIINVKDLLLYNPQEEFCIRDFLREPYFTYEYKKTSELMMEMRKSSINFAIVLDEYGATAGLVTLEDLLEEIVGEIRDEYDTDEEDLIQQISDREYVIEASMKLDDINDLLNFDIISEDYDSIGGILIELLDHLPETGEEAVTENGIRLVAEKVEKQRIEKVRLYLPEAFSTISTMSFPDGDEADFDEKTE
ncbi:HlyC/CorC family transporter [Konateibacter massiliensis]|uniref:HlyC/CorC family transporter n=1 Tax=Konateibacter massiliensis TaxID=2002841 RepID=UPI000C153BD0|nr:hemolysin family protein [Konateibacter massiliensis]